MEARETHSDGDLRRIFKKTRGFLTVRSKNGFLTVSRPTPFGVWRGAKKRDTPTPLDAADERESVNFDSSTVKLPKPNGPGLVSVRRSGCWHKPSQNSPPKKSLSRVSFLWTVLIANIFVFIPF